MKNYSILNKKDTMYYILYMCVWRKLNAFILYLNIYATYSKLLNTDYRFLAWKIGIFTFEYIYMLIIYNNNIFLSV